MASPQNQHLWPCTQSGTKFPSESCPGSRRAHSHRNDTAQQAASHCCSASHLRTSRSGCAISAPRTGRALPFRNPGVWQVQLHLGVILRSTRGRGDQCVSHLTRLPAPLPRDLVLMAGCTFHPQLSRQQPAARALAGPRPSAGRCHARRRHVVFTTGTPARTIRGKRRTPLRIVHAEQSHPTTAEIGSMGTATWGAYIATLILNGLSNTGAFFGRTNAQVRTPPDSAASRYSCRSRFAPVTLPPAPLAGVRRGFCADLAHAPDAADASGLGVQPLGHYLHGAGRRHLPARQPQERGGQRARLAFRVM